MRLGVPLSATRSEIIAAYRVAALKHHPDRGGSSAAFAAVRESFEVLEQHVTPRVYQPASLKSHGRDTNDWSGLWPMLGSVVLPTAVGLGVGIRLMYVGGERSELRAGGISRVTVAEPVPVVRVQVDGAQKHAQSH